MNQTPQVPAKSDRPKRLLLISYEYPPLGGGLGKAVRRTALEFESRGHEVFILTSRVGAQPSEEKDGALTLLRIPVWRRHQNHATVTDVLSFAVSGLLLGRRRLGDFSPDAILAYLTIPSGMIGAWLSRRLKSPLLTLLRGTDVPGHREVAPWMHRLALPVTRWVWRRSNHVVSNSRSMAEAAERAYPKIRARTVYNGVDTQRFCPKPEQAGMLSGPLRVLYAGRLVKVKRLDLLLHAWGKARAHLPEGSTLEIAGFGPERPGLESLVKKLGLETSIRFVGQLDEEAMIHAFRQASIFVSLSLDEGLPNAVLEAMACGVPVLLSDIGPHREILADSRGGRLCDADDPLVVASALVQLSQDLESNAVTADAARAIVVDRFDWARTADELLALIP